MLTAIREGGDPVIVPTLLLPEIASAAARASDDSTGALQYANATAALPHLTLVSLTPTTARQAAELAANHRLRGADAVYLAVARRYGKLSCRVTRSSVHAEPLSSPVRHRKKH